MNLFWGANSYLLKYANSKLKRNIDILWAGAFFGTQTSIVLGLNRVEVGRHGLILEDNGATGSRKVSEYLPDLWDTI